MGRRTGLGAGLAATGALVAILLLVVRKGPMGALVALLIVSVLILVLTVATELLKKKDG